MSRKGLMEQDLSKLDVTKLHPLSPEVISRQATINIGIFFGHEIVILGSDMGFNASQDGLLNESISFIRHHWSCGSWQVYSCESHIGCPGDYHFWAIFISFMNFDSPSFINFINYDNICAIDNITY